MEESKASQMWCVCVCGQGIPTYKFTTVNWKYIAVGLGRL
jgi:hypothetical protein